MHIKKFFNSFYMTIKITLLYRSRLEKTFQNPWYLYEQHFSNRPVSRLGLDAVHLAAEYEALLAPVIPHQRLVAAPRHRHALYRQLLLRAAALHAHVHVAAWNVTSQWDLLIEPRKCVWGSSFNRCCVIVYVFLYLRNLNWFLC